MNGYEIRRFKTTNGNFFVYEVDTLGGDSGYIVIGEGYYVDPEGRPLETKERSRRDNAMYERNIAEMKQGDNFRDETIKGPLAEQLSELFDRRIPKQRVFGKPREVHSPFAVEKLKALREKMGR